MSRFISVLGCLAFVGVLVWLVAWDVVWTNAQTSNIQKENAVICAEIRHNVHVINTTRRDNPKVFAGWPLAFVPQSCK